MTSLIMFIFMFICLKNKYSVLNLEKMFVKSVVSLIMFILYNGFFFCILYNRFYFVYCIIDFLLCFRYHFFLQVKRDILEGRLVTPPSTAALLASYAIQCKGHHSVHVYKGTSLSFFWMKISHCFVKELTFKPLCPL